MNKKLIFVIVADFLLLFSGYNLVYLLRLPDDELDETSRVRFSCFLAAHVIVAISFIIMIKVRQLYSYVLLGFFSCLVIVVMFSFSEGKVFYMHKDPKYVFSRYIGVHEKEELTYLNMYFLIYMYTIIGLMTTILFLVTTEVLICYEQCVFRQSIGRCLRYIEFGEEVKGGECSICLQQFEEGVHFLQINVCKHIFHQKCLMQWITRNKTCPLDRKNIFDDEAEANQ